MSDKGTPLSHDPHSRDTLRQTDTASLKVYLRLLAYIKPYWVLFAISVFGFVIYSASQPAMAQFMEYLLDFIGAEENCESAYLANPLVSGQASADASAPASGGRGPAYMPSLIIVGIVSFRSWPFASCTNCGSVCLIIWPCFPVSTLIGTVPGT